MPEILSVKRLKKNYGQKELIKDLSFIVSEGEFFGLLGPNGAGKSTAIDCILGFQKFHSGEITLLGQHPDKLDRNLFESIGVQFQQSHYQDKLKVKELCQLTSSYYKKPLDYIPLLKAFGLDGKENNFVEKLSGGEKQKLSVLLTLIPQPKIIFLDELTTGLDTLARRQVWSMLKSLKEKGLTVLLTSHYMDEVEALCDRIAILIDGKVAVNAPVKEVISKSGKGSLEEAYLWYIGEESNENI